ncbi:hypothetical protein BKA70DRAFT_513892 [Coprinopsis sp. MPI-PUGE-AT-0042]|nr:hypothetical protein BKA70DRAFT_513892 [Coprinopsis sp. MPI-PUGE-AT-0042]
MARWRQKQSKVTLFASCRRQCSARAYPSAIARFIPQTPCFNDKALHSESTLCLRPPQRRRSASIEVPRGLTKAANTLGMPPTPHIPYLLRLWNIHPGARSIFALVFEMPNVAFGHRETTVFWHGVTKGTVSEAESGDNLIPFVLCGLAHSLRIDLSPCHLREVALTS